MIYTKAGFFLVLVQVDRRIQRAEKKTENRNRTFLLLKNFELLFFSKNFQKFPKDFPPKNDIFCLFFLEILEELVLVSS